MLTDCTKHAGSLGRALETGTAMSSTPKKLLFVDDDPNILDILERM